jgi:hypothetical protein
VSILLPPPLPECELCGEATRRAAFEANGGLCSACARGLADTVRMLPVPAAVASLADARRRRDDRLEDDAQTVYVERYIPPVPGQLELPGEGPA